MIRTLAALTLATGLSFSSLANAQECPFEQECPLGIEEGPRTIAVAQQDDELAKEIREVEEQLGKLLIVDGSGKLSLRPEVRESLPVPPERVEIMLATFVEVGQDGKIRIRNPEAVRPYLPMIRQFLDQGGL